MNYELIDDIELDGIVPEDMPDYSDAFICSASYDGRKMTDEELDALNDDADFVHELVLKQEHGD